MSDLLSAEDYNENYEYAEGSNASYHSIDLLQQHGINQSDIKKLKDAGYCTTESVAYATLKQLLNIKGISEGKVDKILEAAGKVVNTGFQTGIQINEKRKEVVFITTGSSEFDSIIGGGIESGSLTELYGEFRTGKTQLCHTLCVTAQMSRAEGGGEGKVLYIDSENTFRPERIIQISNRFGIDPDIVLDNITCARAFNSDHQNRLLIEASKKMCEDKYALIIVDSATALFRSDYNGRGELSVRQINLSKFIRGLQNLANEYNVAVVFTNQVVACVDGGMTMGGGPDKKPIGGHIIAHASTTRLSFTKAKGNSRKVKVVDSPCLEEKDAIFVIGEGGIMNDEM